MDATYDLRKNVKTAFNLGDVVEVYDHRGNQIEGSLVSGVKFEFTEPPTTPRKFFMHVLSVPDLIDFIKLKVALLQEYLDYDVAIIADPKGDMERFRKWNVDHAGMNVPDKKALTDTKQVTFTYATFQNVIVDKTGNNNLFSEVTFG